MEPEKQIKKKDEIIPSYYTLGGLDVLDIMKMKYSKEQVEGFLIGNILKYIFRYQNKNGIEDLKKIKYYLNRLIESNELENEKEKENVKNK